MNKLVENAKILAAFVRTAPGRLPEAVENACRAVEETSASDSCPASYPALFSEDFPGERSTQRMENGQQVEDDDRAAR